MTAVVSTIVQGQTLIKTIDLTTSPVPVISLPFQTIPPDGPAKLTSVAVNPNTNTIYIGDWGSTRVYIIDGASNTVASAVSTQDLRSTADLGPFQFGVFGTGPNAVMVNPIDNSWAYLGPAGGARFVGTAFAEALNNVAAPSGAVWDPNTNNIYGGGSAYWVTNNLKFIGVGSSCGVATAVAVNPFTNRAYAGCSIVGGAPGGAILAWDAAGFKDKRIPNPPIAQLNGVAPAGLAVNPNTNRIYAAQLTSPNSLDVIDGRTHTLLASIPGLETPPRRLFPQPMAVHTGSNRIFVVNPWSSSVAVFDGNTNTLVNTVSTQGGAVAVAVNETTNTLYVANQAGSVSVFALDPPSTPAAFSVSGAIKDTKGAPAPGVPVTVTGGGVTVTAVTDSLGLYVATGLPAGVYTVTPASAALSFTPFSRSVVITNSNQANVGFTSGPVVSFTLSVGRSNSGTVTSDPAGINCGSTCSAKFVSGTAVTLTAIPPAGKTFSNWTGACSGTQSTCTVVITRDTSVQAVFNK